jgi:hypothetical protein
MTDRDGESQPRLEVLEGGRAFLEREIATALFTPEGGPQVRSLLARLKHRAKLTGVSATDPPEPPSPPR